MKNMHKPLICIVGTGGTIASKYDATIGGHVSAASAQDLVTTVPSIAEIAELSVVEHSNINSALMDTPTAFALRDTLAKILKDDAVTGAVVTHGTATLEETAYLMDLTLGTDKPVVLTGAQRNFDEWDADGPRNLLNAVTIAAHPDARGRGVRTSLGGVIHSARDTTKANPQDLIAFKARDGGPVGFVVDRNVTFLSKPERRLHLSVDYVKDNVQLIRMGQGSNDLLLRACIREHVDGIVVEATAGGNVNRPFYDAVCAALNVSIPVVIGTRLPSGAPHLGKGYPGSFQSMTRRGAISSGYLSGIKARILLMVALAHTSDREQLRQIFARAGGE